MAPEPFLTVPIRRGRDLLHARFRARQIAQLLRFPAHEITLIAAGSFVVAQQARRLLGRVDLCFAVQHRCLHVHARSVRAGAQQPKDMVSLQKPLPGDDQQLAAEDAAWLIRQMQQLTPFRVIDEVAQQNYEVLALLANHRTSQAASDAKSNPTAA